MREGPSGTSAVAALPRRAPGALTRAAGLVVIVLLMAGCGSATTPRPTVATGGPTWSMQSLPGDIDVLNGASCPSASDCWAVGSNATGNGVVVSSATAHGTWDTQALRAPGRQGPKSPGIVRLDSVSCPTVMQCWAVGATSSNSAAVVSTTNGGVTWNSQIIPTGLSTLNGVSCPTATQCWAVGATSSNTAAIIATDDGGTTWSVQAAPGGTRVLNGVSCPTASSCRAVGANASSVGVVIDTTDSGSTWEGESLPVQIASALPSGLYALNGVSCASAKDCWAVGASSSNAAIMLATTDGGRSWASQSLPSGISLLEGVSCPTDKVCGAVGARSSKVAAVVTTTDGGSSWSVDRLPSGISLLSGIACSTTAECRAVGTSASDAGVVAATESA